MMTLTRFHFDAMKERNFGQVTAFKENGEWAFELHGGCTYRKKSIEQLEDDIRSARMWVRDQERRQADTETPELPME
jgi:hypothetical protein